jgi:hypothetical protein
VLFGPSMPLIGIKIPENKNDRLIINPPKMLAKIMFGSQAAKNVPMLNKLTARRKLPNQKVK